MKFVVALPLLVALAGADSGTFSYDPAAGNGPDNWKDLELEGNACGGDSNSPVDLESSACDIFADYKFNVSVMV